MTALVERITATLALHSRGYDPAIGAHRCACGYDDSPVSNADGAWWPEYELSDHEDHQASQVAALFSYQSHRYEKFETKSESGGEGIFRYAGMTSWSVGWRTSHVWTFTAEES